MTRLVTWSPLILNTGLDCKDWIFWSKRSLEHAGDHQWGSSLEKSRLLCEGRGHWRNLKWSGCPSVQLSICQKPMLMGVACQHHERLQSGPKNHIDRLTGCWDTWSPDWLASSFTRKTSLNTGSPCILGHTWHSTSSLSIFDLLQRRNSLPQHQQNCGNFFHYLLFFFFFLGFFFYLFSFSFIFLVSLANNRTPGKSEQLIGALIQVESPLHSGDWGTHSCVLFLFIWYVFFFFFG